MGWEIRPKSNILTAFDMPLVVQIASDKAGTVNFYLDTDPTTIYSQCTVSEGHNECTVFTQNPWASNPDDTLHYIIAEFDGEKKKLNVLYIGTDRTVTFKDENGNILNGDFYLAFEKIGVIYHGEGADTYGIPAMSRLTNAGIDGGIGIFEFMAHKNGKKYYYIIDYKTLDQQIGGATSVEITITPHDRYRVKVVFDKTQFINMLAKQIPLVGDYLGRLANFIVNHLGGYDKYLLEAPVHAILAVSKVLGIDLTIADFEITDTQVIVYYYQDIAPIAEAIVIVALAIGVAWSIASGGIQQIVSEIGATIRTIVASRVDIERISLEKKVVDYCSQNPGDKTCVSETLGALARQRNTNTTEIAIQAYSESQKYKSDADKWRTTTIVLGAVAVIGLLMAPRIRG